MRVVELRVAGGLPVVADAPLVGDHPDGRLWGLPPELVAALQEWALRAGGAGGAGASDAAGLRGRHLAARLSVALGAPVDYLDPVSGHRVALRAVTRTPRPPPVALPPRPPGTAVARGEPTPWGTGLALAGLTAALVLVANVALAAPMITGLGAIGLLVDAVVVAGLVPALWLNRDVPVWRWAVHGTLAGMALAVGVLAVQAVQVLGS